MARLKGIGSFLVITAGVLVVLRMLHAGVPLLVADARPGPFIFASLDQIERQMGFAPLIPAYRPATLGEAPVEITGWFAPEPTVRIAWLGDHALIVTEHEGGDRPSTPPVARPLDDVPESRWWQDGAMAHLVMRRDDVWVSIETNLPVRDLRRFADTLSRY